MKFAHVATPNHRSANPADATILDVLSLALIGNASEQTLGAEGISMPGHTPEALAKEGKTQRRHALARSSWSPDQQPAWFTEKFYSEKIQPLLALIPASAIARQISVSRWYAGRIREGYRPHPRHWQALVELVGVGCE